ncbi:MAG: DUF4214 domain-containing protein [Reyranellaceae bacterium]
MTTTFVYSGAPFSDAGYALVATQAANAVVSIAPESAFHQEGNAGSTAFTFTLTQGGDTSIAHSVAYAVTGGVPYAADANDFAGHVLPTGTVTFAPGETSKTIAVNVAGDTTFEQDESFVVTLSNPSGGLSIDNASATGTIVNDDTAPLVRTHDDAYVVIENHTLTVGASAGVLFNDQGSPTASLVTDSTHGNLNLASDGSLTYTPDPGFTGIDGFTYFASNGDTSGQSQAVIFVTPVLVGATTTLDLLTLNAAEQIAATYVAFFGRGADASGLVFWVGEFNAHLPTQGAAALFANIASSFGVSNEAKALYPFLVNPFSANDAQISSFLDSVYNNMFNRSSDAAGLAYWTGQIKATLAAGEFVGSVLVNIISGTQNSAAGQDITTLMGKVAVSLSYVVEQQHYGTPWSSAADGVNAANLLHGVTSDPQTVLTGIALAHALVHPDV